MKIQVRDVISHLGQDYLVEAVLTYRLNGNIYRLARAADGDVVIWVEPLRDDMDDRLLLLRQVSDLEISVPPPESISYGGRTYVQRLAGKVTVEMVGSAPERPPGGGELWRYRAAGDLFLQIEDLGGRAFVLHGESVHKGMIDILPGK